LGHHYRASKYSVNDNYDTSYTFFRERASRPKVEVSLARDVDRVGFRAVVQLNGIPRPSADCNGTQYNIERQNHNSEIDFIHVNTPYFVYPFGINQDQSVGAYITQFESRGRISFNPNNATTIQASIRISGEGFEMERDYVLRTNLSELRASRLNARELIHTRSITFSLEEVKEPSLWLRFLSSFIVARTRIPK
jgi:hypothetical protein